MALQDIIYTLDRIGFTDVFLPFILIFTIVFATLQKIELFGKGKSKRFNAVISLALSIGVIIPHSLNQYPPGLDVIDILNRALPNVSLLIIAVVFLLVLVGLFGGEAKWGSGIIGGIVSAASVGAVVAIFGSAAGWWETSGILFFLSDPDVQAALIILAVFWLIISTITKEEKKPGILEEVGKFFGATGGSSGGTPPSGGTG